MNNVVYGFSLIDAFKAKIVSASVPNESQTPIANGVYHLENVLNVLTIIYTLHNTTINNT